MFTPHSSKPSMGRVASSLKYGVILLLLGFIVVATERPMLLSPAGAVTVAEQAKARAEASGTSATSGAPVPGPDDTYFPSQFPAPNGPVEDLPPQF
jgi:hypothetical protein